MKLLLAAGGTHLFPPISHFSRRSKFHTFQGEVNFTFFKENFQGENLAVRTCMAGQVPPQATPIKALRKMKSRTFEGKLRTNKESILSDLFHSDL